MTTMVKTDFCSFNYIYDINLELLHLTFSVSSSIYNITDFVKTNRKRSACLVSISNYLSSFLESSDINITGRLSKETSKEFWLVMSNCIFKTKKEFIDFAKWISVITENYLLMLTL